LMNKINIHIDFVKTIRCITCNKEDGVSIFLLRNTVLATWVVCVQIGDRLLLARFSPQRIIQVASTWDKNLQRSMWKAGGHTVTIP